MQLLPGRLVHKDSSHNHIFHEGKIGALVRSGNNFWLFVADQSYESGHWTGLGSHKPEMVKRTCCTCVRVPLQLSNRVTWVKPGSNLSQTWVKPSSNLGQSQSFWTYLILLHCVSYCIFDNVQIYRKPGRPLKFKHTFSTTLWYWNTLMNDLIPHPKSSITTGKSDPWWPVLIHTLVHLLW